MNRAVEDVVLAPFRDIVAHGEAAVKNAEISGDGEMLKAAQVLVKEGERALKRLEPICRKSHEEYGSSFVDSLMENGQISELTEELNDFLYDFEDFLEADSFDADKYSELYALSRKAAPRILHIITRMQLESPASQSITTSPVTENTSIFTDSPLPYPEGPEADGQIYDALRHVAKLDNAPTFLKLPYPEDEDVPHSLGPMMWSRTCQMPEQGANQTARRRETASGFEAQSEHSFSPTSTQIRVSFPPLPRRNSARNPDNHRSNCSGAQSESAAATARYPGAGGVSAAPPYLYTRGSLGSSTVVSSQTSASDYHRGRDSYNEIVSPVSAVEKDPASPEIPGQSLQVPPLFSRSEAKPSILPVGVEDEIIGHGPQAPIRTPPPIPEDCDITLDSSFYRFKGFCKGSMEIIQGGLGVRRIKKQGLSGGFKEVAKCKSCPFELEWAAVEKDLNNEASENFKSAGIGFRFRFLSKSHLAAKHVGDQVYGCLFCIQLGRTTHANDGTVFFSQKQLFNHLARHPRPLPHVPGVTVVEKPNIGLHENNYDLHLVNSPTQSHLAAIAGDLAALPAATAAQTYRPTPTSSAKRPRDGQEIVHFATGAKILGVVFPERYRGEWCLGWADHQYGAFPAETIKLDEPLKRDIMLQGSSCRRAITRWKFSAQEKPSDWLSFSKGEIITNIGWSHQEHWCWSGTNSKGKTGFFPQSHIEPGSVVEVTAGSGQSSIMSHEKKAGLFSRLSIRHRSSGLEGFGLSSRGSIY